MSPGKSPPLPLFLAFLRLTQPYKNQLTFYDMPDKKGPDQTACMQSDQDLICLQSDHDLSCLYM